MINIKSKGFHLPVKAASSTPANNSRPADSFILKAHSKFICRRQSDAETLKVNRFMTETV